jgi:hypothetical protein
MLGRRCTQRHGDSLDMQYPVERRVLVHSYSTGRGAAFLVLLGSIRDCSTLLLCFCLQKVSKPTSFFS